MKEVNKVNWVSWLMHNYRLTFLLFGLCFFLGLWGIDRMPKAEFPDFVIRQGVVAAVYPGATAEEVEMQVARPLERYLFSFDEVKRRKTTSTSSNGMCVMMVELEDEVQNKDEVWSKIRHGLNAFKGQLPQGVMALVVNDDFGDTSALLLALESDQRSYRELKRYADELSDALRQVRMVDKVSIYGEAVEQISIYVDQERLAAYGLGKLQLTQALQASGMTTLSGSLTGWAKDVPIHVKPSAHTEAEIEELVIYTDRENRMVRVKDVAEVKREYDTSERYIEYNDHPCLILSLEMLSGHNIVAFGREVRQVVDDYARTSLPADVTVQCITDQSQVVNDSVVDFLINLLESMVIIVLVMLVLFPWRTAVVAGLIVPLNTFISVGIMYAVGIPLNTVTLAALIIVMGMVVDNAIVVLDGYLEYVGKGMSCWHAAAHSAQHYFMPMALATLCLCVIFFPFLLTMTGMVRDMVYYLPWTIMINLAVSLLLAVGVIPLLEFVMIKPKPVQEEPIGKQAKKFSIIEAVQQLYERCLNWNFRYPWVTIVGGIGLVVLSLLLIAPRLKIRMLPVAERNQFAVEISLPEGSGLAETKAVADSVYAWLSREEQVLSVTRFIGCSSPRFHTAYAPKGEGRNLAQFIVNTRSQRATEMLLDKYDAHSDDFPNAFVKFKQLDYQNFTPFEFRFYGYEADSLRVVAEVAMKQMRQDERVMNVHTDWQEPRRFVEVDLDDVRMARLGMNRTLAQLELALSTGDTQVGQVWEEEFQVPLVLRDCRKESLSSSDINNLYLSVGNASVPLRQVGEAVPEWGANHIVHRNGMRCITVGVEAKRGVYTNALQSHFTELIEAIPLPSGVRFEVGGEPENDQETQEPIMSGMVVAVIAIFFFLLFNFKAYKLAFTSIAALLLCLPGALLGLWWMDRPMGVTAIFGFVTLMGMIMRNEILIFEHAKGLMRQGFSAREAAYDAGKRRMVPIFLTTATTAMGVVPMILAASSFWMPVGVSICVGGIGSLILVVTVLPVVFWKLYEK